MNSLFSEIKQQKFPGLRNCLFLSQKLYDTVAAFPGIKESEKGKLIGVSALEYIGYRIFIERLLPLPFGEGKVAVGLFIDKDGKEIWWVQDETPKVKTQGELSDHLPDSSVMEVAGSSPAVRSKKMKKTIHISLVIFLFIAVALFINANLDEIARLTLALGDFIDEHTEKFTLWLAFILSGLWVSTELYNRNKKDSGK